MSSDNWYNPTVATLHTLEFYVLCPDGRRFRAENLCDEYAKKPSGIFMKAFEDRLVLILEAIFPAEDIYNGSMSVMIDRTPERLYWRQAFYLSTGTSRGSQSYLRENTWMPFHGIVLNTSNSSLSIENYENIPETIGITNFYFVKRSFFTGEYISGDPGGEFFGRFDTISYLLASHALGGNAFSRENSNDNKKKHLSWKDQILKDKLLLEIAPLGIRKKYPQLAYKLLRPSPLQACYIDAIKNTPPTPINVINDFIDKNKAIGRMNVFNTLGLYDAPVPGLKVASLPMEGVSYTIPIEYYNSIIENYVQTLYYKFEENAITKEDLYHLLQMPLSDILRKQHEFTIKRKINEGYLMNYNTEIKKGPSMFQPNKHSLRFAFKNGIPEKNKPYTGGKSKRTQRQKRKNKQTRKQRY